MVQQSPAKQKKKKFTRISVRSWPLKSAVRARVLSPAHLKHSAWQLYTVFLYLLSSIINQESLNSVAKLKPMYLHGAPTWFSLRGQVLTNRSFCWQDHSQGELCNAEKHFSVWNRAVQPPWHSDTQWRSPEPWRMSKTLQGHKTQSSFPLCFLLMLPSGTGLTAISLKKAFPSYLTPNQ